MFSYRLYRFVSWIRYTVPRRFTPAGLLALIPLAAIGAVGADMDQTVAFQIFAFLLSLLLVSMLAAPFFRGRFTARRILPRFGSVGQPLAYHVVIRNASKRTHQNLEVIDELVDPRPTRAEFTRARRRLVLEGFRKLRLAAPVPLQPIASGVKPVALPNLREHAEATVRSELIPLRRGALRFAAVIIARPDPLGLFRGFIRTPLPQSVLILPKRYPLPNFTLPGSRTYQRGGVALASAIGGISSSMSDLNSMRRKLVSGCWLSATLTRLCPITSFSSLFFALRRLLLSASFARPSIPVCIFTFDCK